MGSEMCIRDRYKIEDIKAIHLEVTSRCQAKCPMCARRINGGPLNPFMGLDEISIDKFMEWFPIDFIKQLNHLAICGNLGDPIVAKDTLPIYEYLREANPTMTLQMHTNGSGRTKQWWQKIAKLGVQTVFAIDGLEDTNHLYRRNVKWTKLIENVEAFINAGGHATWDYLKFKHNQNQIEQAELLSKKLGFKKFRLKETTRWDDFDSEGNWVERDHIKLDNYKLEKIERDTEASGHNVTQKTKVKQSFTKAKINCWSYHKNKSEIYIAANGDVSPCCWLGDLRLHEAKNIITDYNAINLNHCSLDEILNGHFFTELAKGIRGVENAYRLQTCYHTCGVSNV